MDNKYHNRVERLAIIEILILEIERIAHDGDMDVFESIYFKGIEQLKTCLDEEIRKYRLQSQYRNYRLSHANEVNIIKRNQAVEDLHRE